MTVIMYKLVSQEMTTYAGMKWELGKTNKATKPGNEMCTDQVLHCYEDPYLARVFNPIHANIPNPILLKIECSEIIANDGLKFACKEQTPVEICKLPNLTTTQHVAFAIKCVLAIYKEQEFVNWAMAWIEGKDRTYSAAAHIAAHAATVAAARAAAADADADAADAYDADAAYAAGATARAAVADADAAYAADATARVAAADAARVAAAYAAGLDFKSIMQWVLENV